MDKVIVLRAETVTLNVDESLPISDSETWYSWMDEFGTVHWTDKDGNELLRFGTLTVSRSEATHDALYLADYHTWLLWPRKESNG